ncbi:MAG: hypothetical protein WC375_06460 [Methanomassiliicoccales archaeon]|jgi:hypothetical protein
MERNKIKFAFFAWAAIALCAIANGMFRGLVLTPAFGETIARMISCVMLITILLAMSNLLLRRSKLDLTERELVVIGMAWLGLTMVFEFGFGHFIEGISWEVLLIDYDVMKGRFWILVLVFTALSPYLAGRILRKQESRELLADAV